MYFIDIRIEFCGRALLSKQYTSILALNAYATGICVSLSFSFVFKRHAERLNAFSYKRVLSQYVHGVVVG